MENTLLKNAHVNGFAEKTCYVYVRVSTDDQKKGYSPDNQVRQAEEFAKVNKYQVMGTFDDSGRSGRTAEKRIELQNLLAAIKEHPVNAVVIFKIDRFARNLQDFTQIYEDFKSKGIELISISEGNLMVGGTSLIPNILASVAQWESEVNGQRTKAAMREKFCEGGWPGWAPLGYKNIKVKDERGYVVVDKVAGPIVKKALSEIFPFGNYSIYSLQKWLFEQGLKSKTGKVIQFSCVHKILTNPFYYGWMKWGGEEKQGKHDPLISKETYDLNQYILAKHRQFMIRERKYDFLLRGFVFCKAHNRRLFAEHHKVNSKANPISSYYHCAAHGGCKGSYIKMDKLEQAVANEFKKFQFSEDFIQLVGQKCRKKFEEMKGDIEKEKRIIINQRTPWENRRNQLENMLLDNTIDRETFKRKHSEIQANINALNLKLLEVDKRRGLDVELIDEVLALTRNIYDAYMQAPKFLKRHYLRFFFESMTVGDRKIVKVAVAPAFLTILRGSKVILRSNWLEHTT